MVPPSSHRVSRVRRYSGNSPPTLPFAYKTLTFYGAPSHALRLEIVDAGGVNSVLSRTPGILLLPVWPVPRSLATTSGISVDVFSSPYLDVSVRAVPPAWLWIHHAVTGSSPAGLPHSETRGSMPAFGSPRLIADRCVLLRLPAPRHSPCTLCSLTIVVHLMSNYLEKITCTRR